MKLNNENIVLLMLSILEPSIFNEMPKWKAGVQNGRPVKVNMNFPVIVEGE